jgi:hypothetical protein
VALRSLLVLVGLSVACDGDIMGGGGGGDDDVDAGVEPAPPGIAPPEVRPDAAAGVDGANPVDVPAGDQVVFRVDAAPGEHVGFDLRFAVGTAGVLLHVDRWDGVAPVPLQVTDGGRGLRVLAVFDPSGPRTFWVRIGGDDPITGATLTITRTPFEDGNRCLADCARLLQLPIPNDPERDGYAIDRAVFRYQFGRRDLVMFLRAAGRRVVAAGMAPFRVADLSQWDGAIPGTDVGSLRHVSHDRGKDVDISLYGDDGEAPFRSYCTTTNDGSGRECVPGTATGYDGDANALLFGSFYASGRVTRCFLDAELIPLTIDGAGRGVAAGAIDGALLPLYSDGVHLQHWPNHDNHIHIRVSEADGPSLGPEPFVAP